MQVGNSLGAIVGPAMGGLLVGLWLSSMPYALPALACAVVQLTAAILGLAFIPNQPVPRNTALTEEDEGDVEAPKLRVYEPSHTNPRQPVISKEVQNILPASYQRR